MKVEALDALTDLHYLIRHDTATSLIDSISLARRTGVARVFIKAEWQRPLGNFKSLGGMLASLRALARHCGAPSVAALLENTRTPRELPQLICASDGNHGLAVAAAAQRSATGCTVYLPQDASSVRIARIATHGARVVIVSGTYDDAVEAAQNAAARAEGLLVPDTSADPRDSVVRDVMAGYSRIATELLAQFREIGAWPTHVFMQAGVGGLAAALVQGLKVALPGSCRWIVVEPTNAACVSLALDAGHPVRVEGALQTSAKMLSCGLASAAALAILKEAAVTATQVDDAALSVAVKELRALTGIETTPSGAAGVAGLLRMASLDADTNTCGLGAESKVLLLVTEGPVVGE